MKKRLKTAKNRRNLKASFINHLLSFSILCIALLLSGATASAQTITGVVVDESTGSAIIGASIQVKGTATGSVSDANGKFTLTALPKDAVLIVSYVGYLKQEVEVAGRKDVTIKIKTDNALKEVVVVGFGTQKKANLTGAVGVATAKDIADRPVMLASQALQGIVPGLNISQNNGSLGDQPSINIRGLGSLNGGSPLVLIDGMEGDLNVLNPQDIESISVLKDAGSAAIYGARAAFGVIIVTTKRGVAGKTKINYNNSFRWSSPVLLPKQMDSYTFANYFNDGAANAGYGAIFDAEHMQRIIDFQSGKITTTDIPNPSNPLYWADGYGYGNDNVDWLRAVYRNQSFSQEHNVSVSGGNSKVTYYLSGNFLHNDGLMRYNQDHYNRYTGTAKINATVSDQFKINYNSRFVRTDLQQPVNLNNGTYDGVGRQGWPTLPLYDPNGHLFGSPSPVISIADGGNLNKQEDYLYQQIQLVYEPIKGWKTFGEFNYSTDNLLYKTVNTPFYNYDVAGNPYVYGSYSSVAQQTSRNNYLNLNVYSQYEKSINDEHNFKLMIGFQTENTKLTQFGANRQGIIDPSVPEINTTTGNDYYGNVTTPEVYGSYNQWATAGFFGRLNYDYKGRYLVELNLRRDGTSRFRADHRWAWFPSVSAGWNIAKEDFWQDRTKAIGTFKLRGSYGSLGNQNGDKNKPYTWYPTYQTMPVYAASGSWLVDGTRPNTSFAPGLISQNLTWETVSTLDFGLDISALNNRLTSSFDWYNRKTTNILRAGSPLPTILGVGIPDENNTDLKTLGYEFSLQWKDVLSNGFSYSAKFTLADAQTTITRYYNPTGSIYDYNVGQKIGTIWGYTTKGIAKTQEEMDAHLATLSNGGQSPMGSKWGAGDIMYVDKNGDGKIDGGAGTLSDHGDMSIIGNSTPRFNYGIDLSCAYKGFDFRAFFQGVGKRDYWQGSYFFWGIAGNEWWSGGFEPQTDYFRSDPKSPLGQNLDSYFPRPIFDTNKNQQTQTRYLQDASYIRLKNMQIGYTIPAALTHKWGLQSLRVFASGDNLWTATKMFKTFDPETVDGGSGGSVYPLSKVMSVGLSVNF